MIDYSTLLKNYKEIKIDFKDFCTLIGCNLLEEMNKELAELLKQYNLSHKNIDRIILKRDGFYFSSEMIIDDILKIYGIKDYASLKSIIRELTDKNIDVFKLPSQKLYEVYERFTKSLPSQRPKMSKVIAMLQEELIQRIQYIEAIKDNPTFWKINADKITDKLKLYIAVRVMEHTKNSLEKKEFDKYQSGIQYLKDFIKESTDLVDRNFEFSINGKWYKISDILAYMKGYIEVKPKPKQSEELLERHNYSFFPLGKIESRKRLMEMLQDEKIKYKPEYLRQLLARKINFYTNLPYTKIQLGTDSFDGYIGFELENGLVVLDKFYENRISGKIASDYAIYIVEKEDFESITRMSRTQAMNAIKIGAISAKRVTHANNFEEKVLEITKKKGN